MFARKRLTVLTIIVYAMFLLTSCSIAESYNASVFNDEQKAGETMEQTLDAVKNRDAEKLKSLFSVKALNSAENLDGNADALVDFIKGDIISVDDLGGPAIYEENEYGQTLKQTQLSVIVTTDEEKYMLFFLEYTVDMKDSDNVGLYTIAAVREKDRDTKFVNWQNRMTPGIVVIA